MSIQGIGNEISFSDYHSAVVALRESAPFAPERGLESLSEVARARAQISTWNTSANTLFDYPHPWPVAPFQVPGLGGAIDNAVEAVRISVGVTVASVPTDMGANWERLRNSALPERVFNELLSAATSSKRLLGRFAPLSAKSLSMFLDLWDAVKIFAAEPVVSVTPKGCVVAEWLSDERNSLAVLVNANDALIYSLFENGVPLEDSVATAQLSDFVHAMLARAQNPFLWSDA